MAADADELAQWTGRDLFDANGQRIGTIAGLGFPRRKYATWWLLVGDTGGKDLLIPAEPIRSSHDRLVLPYTKGYVEFAPAFEQDRPLSKADERRLGLHYGFCGRMPGNECRNGCGLCIAHKRVERLT